MISIKQKTTNNLRRKFLLGGLAASAAGLLQACGGSSSNSSSNKSESGLSDENNRALASTTVVSEPATLRPIPAYSISLASYGGVPGASASTIVNAFNNAYAALKANGGGTLVIPPGTYHLGSYGSNTQATNVSNMHNVLISGYGATLTITTTAAAVPSILHFQNCSNINIAGLHFTDPGTDLTINWKGAVCIQASCTVACDGYKVYDCTANSVLTLFKAYGGGGAANYLLTNLDITGTVTNAYYGINVNYTGRNSKCNLTTNGVRRAFICYGAQNWNVKVDHTPKSTAQSNSLIELPNDANGDVSDIIINVIVRGNLSYHTGIVGFQQQGPLSATPVIKNVKANVVVQNATGAPGAALFWFMHDDGSQILGNTNRNWINIECTGTVDTVSSSVMNGRIVQSRTPTSGTQSSIRVSTQFNGLQNFAALPPYFSMFTPSSTQCAA